MLISVITLSYNSNATIFQTIDSVLKQDYAEIEYIISDDGTSGFDVTEYEQYISTHNLGNIKNFSVIHNTENIGTIRNLNNAIKRSSGEIIITLSADDIFADEKVVSDWVSEFIKTNASVITAKRAVFDNSMQKFICVQPDKREIDIIKTSLTTELFEYIAPKNIIFGCCTARTRESFKKYGYFNEKYKYIEDYSMNLQLLKQGANIQFFDRVVIKYRSSGISAAPSVNEEYLTENYSIFESEALPYVQDKKRVIKEYKKWKKSLKLSQRYAWIKGQLANEKFFRKCYAIILFYMVWYPFLTMTKVLKKFFSLFKKENIQEYEDI